MGKLYGWYSITAFNNGSKEYIYLNDENQETYCTFITKEKINPYGNGSVYCGEVNTFLYSQTKFDNNISVIVKD
tara:strand:+ start:185 stop:406 length:222 start_codon:yes stop_codon:yes gene_type:complete